MWCNFGIPQMFLSKDWWESNNSWIQVPFSIEVRLNRSDIPSSLWHPQLHRLLFPLSILPVSLWYILSCTECFVCSSSSNLTLCSWRLLLKLAAQWPRIENIDLSCSSTGILSFVYWRIPWRPGCNWESETSSDAKATTTSREAEEEDMNQPNKTADDGNVDLEDESWVGHQILHFFPISHHMIVARRYLASRPRKNWITSSENVIKFRGIGTVTGSITSGGRKKFWELVCQDWRDEPR